MWERVIARIIKVVEGGCYSNIKQNVVAIVTEDGCYSNYYGRGW